MPPHLILDDREERRAAIRVEDVALRQINRVCIIERAARREYDPRIAAIECDQIGNLLAKRIDDVQFITT